MMSVSALVSFLFFLQLYTLKCSCYFIVGVFLHNYSASLFRARDILVT